MPMSVFEQDHMEMHCRQQLPVAQLEIVGLLMSRGTEVDPPAPEWEGLLAKIRKLDRGKRNCLGNPTKYLVARSSN